AQEQPVDGLGADEGDAQLQEVLSGGTTGARAKVLTRDNDVTGLDFRAPIRTVGGETGEVPLIEGQIARRARLDEIGVDVVAKLPDPASEHHEPPDTPTDSLANEAMKKAVFPRFRVDKEFSGTSKR